MAKLKKKDVGGGKDKKVSLWRTPISKLPAAIMDRIYPGFDEDRNAQSSDFVDMPSQSLAIGGDTYTDALLRAQGILPESSGEDDQLLDKLPIDRLARYGVFMGMLEDPTISSAISMHVSQALSAKTGTGEIISIESVSDKDDPITIDLRNTFKDMVNSKCQSWAYNAAAIGCWYVRPYGQRGKGIEHVRSDYYTHPRFIYEYEHGGRLAGYTHAHQNPARDGRVIVIEPWKFVAFKLPRWHMDSTIEPIRHDLDVFDIRDDDCYREELVEAQDYGESLLRTAFSPWYDLQNAILSLNMSRRNAARLERLVGVQTGKLSPVKAAEYLNTVSSRLKRANEAHANQSLSKGFVQTIVNHLVPIFGDRGRLDISTIEGSPNIEGLEDVKFHVNRLGGAIGVDPSLLGFGDMLSGGLGEGGYFRLSILAAMKSEAIRRAIRTGLEELFCIHVALKHGKYFLPGERPWRIVFNSISTALEREESENIQTRINTATMIAQIVQLIDPEFSKCDFGAFSNYLFTDMLRMDEEKFKAIFPEKIEPPEEGRVEESAFIDSVMNRFYQGE